jgi:hypothetical protein
MERIAVFTKGLTEEQKKEILNYAKSSYDFFGEYSEEKSLLEDAVERVVERQEDSVQVIDRGKFDLVLVFDSLAGEIKTELEDLGIETISFKKQMQIKKNKHEETEEIEVNVKNIGEYKKIEPL